VEVLWIAQAQRFLHEVPDPNARPALRRRKPKERTPTLSNEPVDKIMASLNYMIGKWGTKNADYVKAPSYFDACCEWFQLLPLDHREIVSLVIDVWVFPDRRPLAGEDCDVSAAGAEVSGRAGPR
jgi:hypothetical protein